MPPGFADATISADARPEPVGWNWTVTVHVASGWSTALQLLAWTNWPGAEPASITDGTPVAAPPVFVIVKAWPALVLPMPIEPKSFEIGEMSSCGPGRPLPLR